MEMLALNNPSKPRARLSIRRTYEPERAMREALSATGSRQRDLVTSSQEPQSGWLRTTWRAARDSGRESEQQALPERALARLEADDATVALADFEFLRKLALAEEAPSWEAVASLRLLASLAEDERAPKELLAEPLIAALDLEDPARRFAAVEGLWQCDATSAIPSLETLLAKEKHSQIRATVEHALLVLRGLSDGDD